MSGADSPTPSNQPQRDRVRRRKLPVFLVAGLLVAWLAWRVSPVGVQRATVAWVEARGGQVYYDFECDVETLEVKVSEYQRVHNKSKWIDFWASPVRVEMSGAHVVHVSPLAKLSALRYLSLADTRVEDLTSLGNLTKLESLYLFGSPVADVAPLSKLTELRMLDLASTRVTNLAPLVTLNQLNKLFLHGTPVTDIAPLAKLTSLQELCLYATPVADVAPLATLTGLRVLDLRLTQVGEASLEALRRARPSLAIDR